MQTSSSVITCCLTMEKLGLLVFLLLVLYTNAETPEPSVLKEYVYVENNLTWYEARTYCRNHFYELFRVSDNLTDLRNLTGPASQLSWIGLFKWSVSWWWVDASPAVYLNWYRSENCAVTNRNGIWFDMPCNYAFPFVCQIGPLKWHYRADATSWENAKSACELHTKKLAIIQNWEDNYNITGVIPDSAWIGLHKVTDNTALIDTWKWINNQPPTFSNFFTPLFCAVMDRRGFWYDRVCFEKNLFVCFRQSSVTEYVLVTEGKTWHDAKKHCEMSSMKLVMAKSQTENTALLNYIMGVQGGLPAGNSYFWIGLYNDPWYWSEGSSDIRNWNSMQPDGKDFNSDTIPNNIQSCVASKNGEWFDEDCTKPRYFFCSAMVRSTILVSEPKSWEEALDHCRDRYVDLASVGLEGEQTVTMRHIKELGYVTGYVWTGLRFLAGSWFWVYGDDLQYQNWLGGAQPQCPVQHHCGALNVTTGKWEPRSCEERLNFLCFQQ